jgi:hypothetical protein
MTVNTLSSRDLQFLEYDPIKNEQRDDVRVPERAVQRVIVFQPQVRRNQWIAMTGRRVFMFALSSNVATDGRAASIPATTTVKTLGAAPVRS